MFSFFSRGVSKKFHASPVQMEEYLRELFDNQVSATHPIISLESQIYMSLCFVLKNSPDDFSILLLLQYTVMALERFEESLISYSNFHLELDSRSTNAVYFGGKEYQPLEIICRDILTKYIQETSPNREETIRAKTFASEATKSLKGCPHLITNEITNYFYRMKPSKVEVMNTDTGDKFQGMADEYTPLLNCQK